MIKAEVFLQESYFKHLFPHCPIFALPHGWISGLKTGPAIISEPKQNDSRSVRWNHDYPLTGPSIHTRARPRTRPVICFS